MKVSQKTLEYILLLAIVVVGFCAYKFGYMNFIEKANEVNTSNKAIEARIETLKNKETHREEWIEAIKGADTKIADIYGRYGAGNTPEKSIMFINGLEQATGASIPSLSFYADEVIYSSSMVNELGEPKATAYSTDLAINYSATYQGLKDIVDYINNYKERMNIKSFTAVYSEETGGVTGSMVIGLYSVNDETHIYKAPEVIGVKIGTDNIFNSFD